jgi:hypothetical protein
MQTQQQRQLQDSESAAAALKTQEALLRLHCAAIKVHSLNCFKDFFFAYTFTPGRQSCSRSFGSSHRSGTVGGACATCRMNYLLKFLNCIPAHLFCRMGLPIFLSRGTIPENLPKQAPNSIIF